MYLWCLQTRELLGSILRIWAKSSWFQRVPLDYRRFLLSDVNKLTKLRVTAKYGSCFCTVSKTYKCEEEKSPSGREDNVRGNKSPEDQLLSEITPSRGNCRACDNDDGKYRDSNLTTKWGQINVFPEDRDFHPCIGGEITCEHVLSAQCWW